MQSVIEASRIDHADNSRTISRGLGISGLFRRRVRMGSTLFQPGETRQLYRVESGAICHYVQPAEGSYEIIEFAFSGDIIGLGRLAKHVTTAKAMVETTVSVITDADIDRALTNDNRLFFRIAEAVEREFDYLKNRSLKASLGPPIQRVANFLLAIVSINASEGRALLLVADDVSSGYAAEQLQMSIDALAGALLSLRRSGLVDVSDNRLRILDINALETLAADA
jgi:CRP/FNR family transcriptional regulator, anaerobic regulatory protein